MPVKMHVLYVVVNMEVPLMSIFMEILILLFRELYNSYGSMFCCHSFFITITCICLAPCFFFFPFLFTTFHLIFHAPNGYLIGLL